jgi:hypothetical protein
VKTLSLPHKPTALYVSDEDSLSVLFRYRSGRDVYGLTDTLNLYSKTTEDDFSAKLDAVIEEYKLTGRVFELTESVLFVGTREGLVRPYQLRPFHLEAPLFKASKHRITYLHYCGARD